jgi:hypothetical protein
MIPLMSDSQMQWACLLSLTCWNISARSHFAATIGFHIIFVKNDGLVIKMRKDKSLQDGDLDKCVDRHVYANSANPWASFVFFLGIRVLTVKHTTPSAYICGDEPHVKADVGKSKKDASKEGAFGDLIRKLFAVIYSFIFNSYICIITYLILILT